MSDEEFPDDAVRIDCVIPFSFAIDRDLYEDWQQGDAGAVNEVRMLIETNAMETMAAAHNVDILQTRPVEAWLIDGGQGQVIRRLKKWES